MINEENLKKIASDLEKNLVLADNFLSNYKGEMEKKDREELRHIIAKLFFVAIDLQDELSEAQGKEKGDPK